MKNEKAKVMLWRGFWPLHFLLSGAWLLMNLEAEVWALAIMAAVCTMSAVASTVLLIDVWRRRVAHRRGVRARVRERERAHKAACEFAGSQEAKPKRVFDELPLTPEEMVSAKERLSMLAGRGLAEHFEKQCETKEESSYSDEVIWAPKEPGR